MRWGYLYRLKRRELYNKSPLCYTYTQTSHRPESIAMQTTQNSQTEPSLADFYAQVARFQNLKDKTGRNKVEVGTSYHLNFNFDPWTDAVGVEWGCGNVEGYPRHYHTHTTRPNLLAHLAAEIEKMERVVAADSLDEGR